MARLKLYLRNKTWWVSGTIRGDRIRESTGHTNKGKAQSWAARREWELDQEDIYGVESVYTFGAALNGYIDSGGEQRFLLPLLDAWGHRLMKDIGPGDVIDLANQLYPNKSAATKNRQVITPVVAIFRHAAARKKAAPLIVPRFETKRILTRRTATWEWVAKLAKAAKPKIIALVIFQASTAARISDALKLEWADVDLKAGTALLRDTKNGEDRIVTLLPEAVEALTVIHKRGAKGRVFQFYDRSDALRQVKTACGKAKIPYIPSHGYGRRLFATTMNRNGVDPKTAARDGGWKTVRMYMEIYAQPDDAGKAVKSVIGTELSQALRRTRKKT